MTAGEAAPAPAPAAGGSGLGPGTGKGSFLPPLYLPWVPAAVMVVVVVAFFTHRRRSIRSPHNLGLAGQKSESLLPSFLSSFSNSGSNRPRRHPRRPSSSSCISSLVAAVAYFAATAAIVVLVLAAMHSLRQFAAHAAVASSVAGGLAFGAPAPASWSGSVPKASTCDATSQWPGWKGIQYAFIFGDSYTQTGFNYSITPTPSIDNPLGNPPYPGWTSSNGPNWVGFLSTKYNASRLRTYNLAYGGATVDSDIVQPYRPTVLSMKDQVHSEFLPGYTNHGNSDTDVSETHPSAPDAPAWQGNDTVFAIWIGINDVGNSYHHGVDGVNGTTEINRRIFEVYGDMVGMLYNAGGRNFVFLTVPPVDRSPLTTAGGDAAAQALEKADIAAFNSLLKDGLAADLKSQHADHANVWVVDTGLVFNAAMDDPASFPQTAGLKNTTSFCAAYGK
ncbi:hypothetical protein SPBR_03948 [Sporothrix brasiliensis 5110]|uniref:Carbohydrate esterase family 16 protein n=1 Tax=Sporothrix brasiliensis 5110 TaxID=1398154 RepID=A0A0C2F8C8_9PEZI|nr:uncharacterized protein SPBR_03948 [Sporothrix brasiliensis 5110]KIH95309.1 hypothetical protein SPBR_03948 [Sporothrix brasiliensis 5110]